MDETSAGVYEVKAEDEAGLRVQITGTDPDEWLSRCRQTAFELTQSARSR
jgi:hypothetical protein